MRSRAKLEMIQDIEVPIFTGSITRLWNSLGASNAYYSKVIRNLTDLGCIQILQRGSSNVESRVACIRMPDQGEVKAKSVLTNAPSLGTLAQEVANLHRNIGGIDIADALKNFEERLSKVEREVAKINGTSQTVSN